MAYNCTSSIYSIRDFSQSILITLRAINSCIALLNIFGNGFLIYALKKTGQTTSLSLQLVVLMSSSDCINGIVALFLTNMILWKRYDSYCFLKLITQSIHMVFAGFSFYLVLLIALDRFLHIKYWQRYLKIVSKRKACVLVFIGFFHRVLIAFTMTMPFMKTYVILGRFGNIYTATVLMIFVFILYFKTTKAVKRRVSSMHSIFQKRAMAQNMTLVNAAFSISICMAILLTPHIISYIVAEVSKSNKAQKTTELAIFGWLSYMALLAHGVCSCIIFTLQNKPVKRLIKGIAMNSPSE